MFDARPVSVVRVVLAPVFEDRTVFVELTLHESRLHCLYCHWWLLFSLGAHELVHKELKVLIFIDDAC